MTTIRDRQREKHTAIALLPAVIATAMYLAAGTSAQATDCYFTNTTASLAYFTNSANWNPAVPGAGDNAIFTNVPNNLVVDFGNAGIIANANVYFNCPTLPDWPVGRITLLSLSTYRVTNSLVVGQSANTTNTVIWHVNSGMLTVTNAGGTARLIVGQEGQGSFYLGADAVVDHLYVTNNGALVNGFILYNYGNLTIRGDSTINTINVNWNEIGWTTRLNVIGGTTIVQTNQEFGVYQKTILTVSGTNTVMNFQGPLDIGRRENDNRVIVTNGATVNISGATIVGWWADPGHTPDNNLVVVTGSNSLFNASGGLITGQYGGSSNQVQVANGGRLNTSSFYLGNSTGAYDNTLTVTGAGSMLTNSGAMSIGYSGDTLGGGNQLVLGSGSRVFTTNLDLQDNALTNTLKFVADPGSTNLGIVNVSGALTIANPATARLVVDMSQYTEWRAGVTSVVLVTYGSLPTPFSAGNIAVTPPPKQPWRITATVDQTTGNRIQVNLKMSKGTIISVR